MKRLLSIANDSFTLNKIGNNKKEINELLNYLNIDGFEILKVEEINNSIIDGDKYIGRHLFFYPMWFSFIKENKEELIEDFNTLENAYSYYRGKTKDDFINNLKEEFIDAKNDKVSYVVLHISHMSIKEAYSYMYKYSSMELVKEYIDIINKAMDGLDPEFDLLLENNWYPGLNFKERDILKYIIENSNYKKTFFLLDTGHLINTNIDITTKEEALDYIVDTINELGCLKDYIKGIHLNMSINGKYVKETIKNNPYNECDSFEDKIQKAMDHISKIDKHDPFIHNKINDFIKYIGPKYLVYEFSFSNKEELTRKVEIQNNYLK